MPPSQPPAPDREDDQLGSPFLGYGSVERLLGSLPFWWAISLFLAGIQSWTSQHAMNPDGMSYLDMASAALEGGPKHLVNGYWSPGYPALISLAFFILRPSPALEFPVIHLVNFAVFSLVLLSFTFFLKSWLAVDAADPVFKQEYPLLVSYCFSVFLWFTLDFITLSVATPDLGVAAIVFLAAGICCRIPLSTSKYLHSIALGSILGLGYYVKAAVFPLSLILLAVLFVWPPARNRSRFQVCVSGFALLAVAAPLVALVSSRVGHLTTGETGRLNYAWFTNGLRPYAGWTGEINDPNGTPAHPPRVLIGQPTILEFAEPIEGTYPLWFDPSYWYAGVKVHFDLRGQLKALRVNLMFFLEECAQMSCFFAGAMILGIGTSRRVVFGSKDRILLWFLIWPITACLMYSFVHAESRFLGAFFVLFWLALYRLLGRKVVATVRFVVLGLVLCSLMISVTVPPLLASAWAVRGKVYAEEPDYLQVASALRAVGISREDRLAIAGGAFDAYYARNIGARITANIVESDQLRSMSAEGLDSLRDRLAAIGVKALVTKDRPLNADSAYWKDVLVSGSPRFSILLITTSVGN